MPTREGRVEAAGAGVALAAGAPAQLVVYAARLVALGADDVQAALLGHAGPQDDVGAPAGHVGGDGHGAGLAGVGHDLRLPRRLLGLGVEHLVLDALAVQQLAELLAVLDAGGADQHGPRLLMRLGDLLGYGLPLLLLGAEDAVGELLPDQRQVGRDGHDAEPVDLVELLGLGHGRARHAGQLPVKAEEVLERDAGDGLGLLLDAEPLLDGDGLVDAAAPDAPLHQAAGELVHDDHLAVLDDVVLVPLEELVDLDGRLDEVGPVHRLLDVEAVHPQHPLGARNPLVGQSDGLLLELDLVVAAGRQGLGDVVGHVVLLGLVHHGAADDEGHARLVHQDVVHFVHDGVVEPAHQLHLRVRAVAHVVPQVVEAELGVGAVGDVAEIRLSFLIGVLLGLDGAGGEADQVVDGPHPLAVAAGQVVVDGHHVHAVAGQGVQVGGEGSHQRLALAGDHLGYHAPVQHDAPDELHVEGAHHGIGAVRGGRDEHPASRLAHVGERLGEDLIQDALPLLVAPRAAQALAEALGQAPQLGVAPALELRLQRVDAVHQRHHLAQDPLVGRADDALGHVRHFPQNGSYHKRLFRKD